MPRSSSSSSSSTTAASSSSQRSKKAEGATPTPVRPRRRKQPSNNTTAKKGGGRNTTIDGVGDYSFLGDDSNGIIMMDGDSQQGRVKVNASGRDKENQMNQRPRKDKRTPRDSNLTTTTMQRDNSKTAKTKGNNIDELNDAMARVSLGDNNNNNKKQREQDTSFEPPPLEYTMDTCPPLGYGANQLRISTSTSTKDQLLATLQNSIQTLANMKGGQTAATTIDPTTYKLLLQNTTLLETIASTSHSLTSSPSIIIEEHSSKLVDVAKKCLKALTSLTEEEKGKKKSNNSTSNDNDNKVESALLRIAIHSLRSITPTLDLSSESSSSSKSMYEMVIKLFYHCVVIAGDACHQTFQSFGNNSTKKKDNDVGVVLDYALLCLGSYEGLGRLLNCNSKQNKTKKDGSVAWDEMLPVPKIGESFNSDTTTTPLPQKQLVKIALESSQCAASSLLYLALVALHVNSSSSKSSNEGRGREWTIPNDFHFASNVIYEMCSGKYSGTPPMFQKILTNVTLPYILRSLLETKGSSSSKKNTVVTTITNIDALRQVKKVYRILWDGARSMEEVGKLSNHSTTLRIGSLNLYCGAIIFILDALHQCFELCSSTTNLSDTDQGEVNALFDRATSSAMKAAAVFEKSAGIFATSGKGSKQVEGSSSLAKNKKALLQFHNVVGTKLRKCTLLCGDASPLSASYFEYCTYRSVHLFRLTGKYALSTFTLKDAAKAVNLDDDCLMAMWTFFVVDLSLQARHGMGSSTAALSVSEKEIELIISSFEKRIINASMTIQSRARSVLLLAELHKEATKILSATSDETNTEKGLFLAVMGSILDRCMAPLELMLAKSQKDASRCMNFRLSSSDVHAKSALFYTIASEVSNVEEKERFSSKSDSQLQKSFDILMKVISSTEDNKIEGNTQCISAVEMFAKVSLTSCFLLVIVPCVSNAY